MPVKIQCPLCGTEMTVSDAAMQSKVACPWCRHRFRPESALPQQPESKARPAEPPVASPPVAPAGPEPAREEAKKEGKKVSEISPAKVERSGAKDQGTLPAARERPGVEQARKDVPPEKNRFRGDGAGAARSERVAKVDSPVTGGTATAGGKKVARLILTQTAEPAWKLAPDGSLPSLHLQEDSPDEKKREVKRSSNPVLLAVVLAASLLTSLALLFVEPVPATRSNLEELERAREELAAEYYSSLNPNAPLAEYQRLLREAHWAHSRGDHQRERELYRQVLLLLYAEKGRNSYTGLTGSRSRDERLEELLRILLKE
ncbi:hypothetical protein [Thermogutta sp.]|uniref:hypothetical protein n=1 Tax=Thermogutta sp. TaxID=1962930 RepID=UPI00321FEF18